MEKKPRLINRQHHLLPTSTPPNPVYHELVAKFKNELIHAQREALEKEEAKEDSVLYGMEDDEEVVQDVKKRVRFKARQELAKRYRDGVLEFYHHYLKKYYNRELTSRTLWEPKKWLLRSPVWVRLERGRFKDVYGYLHDHVLPPYHKDTKALIQRAGGRCWEGGDLPANGQDKQDAIVMVDWEEMSEELEMTIGGLRKYLPAFADAGILICLPQKLERGRLVYSIGYHGGYYNKKQDRWGAKLFRYLKEDKAIIEGLERMRLPR